MRKTLAARPGCGCRPPSFAKGCPRWAENSSRAIGFRECLSSLRQTARCKAGALDNVGHLRRATGFGRVCACNAVEVAHAQERSSPQTDHRRRSALTANVVEVAPAGARWSCAFDFVTHQQLRPATSRTRRAAVGRRRRGGPALSAAPLRACCPGSNRNAFNVLPATLASSWRRQPRR